MYLQPKKESQDEDKSIGHSSVSYALSHARSEHADVLLELIRVYQRLQHVPSFREHWLAVGFRQLVRVCPIRCDGTDAAAQTAADGCHGPAQRACHSTVAADGFRRHAVSLRALSAFVCHEGMCVRARARASHWRLSVSATHARACPLLDTHQFHVYLRTCLNMRLSVTVPHLKPQPFRAPAHARSRKAARKCTPLAHLPAVATCTLLPRTWAGSRPQATCTRQPAEVCTRQPRVSQRLCTRRPTSFITLHLR